MTAEPEQKRMTASLDDDPMRVRGSFYMAKSGQGAFGCFDQEKPKFSAKGKKSTSPGNGKLNFPKKKTKLRQLKLEPLNVKSGQTKIKDSSNNVIVSGGLTTAETPAMNSIKSIYCNKK